MIDSMLNMIPGPTPVHDRILEALARPTTSHLAPSFQDLYRDCLAGMKRIAMTEQAQPFVVAGSGTLAMEMALVNLVGRDERVLVISQGFFGDRWAQLAEAFGLSCDLVQSEWGRAVPVEDVRERVASGTYKAVAMTHVDTSTGTAAPVSEYCELFKGRRELLVLDGVCATAAMEEQFDAWGLDVLITGAQKALGAPPGLAILLASPRAVETRREMAAVPAYSADMLRWLPIMDNPGLYFSTPPVNAIASLHEATRIVLEEGLEQRFARHRRIAAAIRAGLGAIDLELFTADDCLAETLSVVRYPEGIDDASFRSRMAARGIAVAGALGSIAGRAFRIGHMGNIGPGEVCRLLESIESSLIELGREVRRGSALSAAGSRL